MASVVQRLAVLLAAGVAPASSWQYLADQPTGPATPVLMEVARTASIGDPVPPGIIAGIAGLPDGSDSAWRGVAAAWQVATDAGAPLAPTLMELAGSLRGLAQVQREVVSALAGPIATARMVMALPAVGVLFGLALGFDTVGTLVGNPLGIACLVLGCVLLLAGRAWNRHLVAAAQPTDLTPGLELDLMAIAVSGGASIPRAKKAVTTAAAACGITFDLAASAVDEALTLSHRAGVPAAGLLRSEADEQRRIARSEGERRAATLAVTLMIPLGVCVLPAFMLLGVAPLLISVISSTVTRF